MWIEPKEAQMTSDFEEQKNHKHFLRKDFLSNDYK